MKTLPTSLRISCLAIALAFSLFFLPIPLRFTAHWHHHLWDLGHTLAFAGISLVILIILDFKNASVATKLSTIVVTTLIIGGLIEIIQTFAGREASLFDLFLDVCGSLIAICIWFAIKQKRGSLGPRIILSVCAAVLTIGATHRLLATAYDDYRATLDFPVLVSATYQGEVNRLYGKPEVLFYSNPFDQSNAISIRFAPAQYSIIYLRGFPKDWSGYGQLEFRLVSTDPHPFLLSIAITDEQHSLNGNQHSDQFNHATHLEQGFSHLKIPLTRVRI